MSEKKLTAEALVPLGGGFYVLDDDIDDGEVDEDCPTVRFSVEEKRRLRSVWSKAVIIKLLGHIVRYNFLSNV